ncbi:Acetylornithine deacetylase [hydrothermal vent metagenome]|uniref:Acetylornithine deacetylase n=1 Tax=hydrothermal vent metagenome TaxID=652676 RepID=A0A3B0YMV8_9ZZZZ
MNFPKFQQMLTTLISTGSVSCIHQEIDMSNLSIIQVLETWLAQAGFVTQIELLPNQAHSSNQKANLTAILYPDTVKPTEDGSVHGGLILSGHTDTVPFDETLWNSAPLAVTEKDNKFYGLGSCDMKAFFAIALTAIEKYNRSDFKKTLILVATADEESTMEGARVLAEQNKIHADYALIGEPTNLRPVRMHKGMLSDSITVIGQSGHSSNPQLGASALEGMHQVMQDLLVWRDQLQQRYHNNAFTVPVPTMNFGHIHGGDNPNRICGACELHFDLRCLPGMARNELREQIKEITAQALVNSNLHFDYKILFQGIPAFETDSNSEIVKMTEALSGHSAHSVAFGTEAPYFQNLKCETIILGPGSIDQAHQANEFVAHNQIKPMIKLVQQLVEKTCM